MKPVAVDLGATATLPNISMNMVAGIDGSRTAGGR
jgi:hypothetical protein